MRVHTSHCIVVLLVGLAVSSTAYGDIVFDFNALRGLDGSSQVQAYMTDVYSEAVAGATVSVSGALSNGQGVGIGRLLGKEFTIQFSQAIAGVGFDGWVLWETAGADFRAIALDSEGVELGTIYERDHVGWRSFNVPLQSLDTGVFGADVFGLKFTDHGIADVGIDNLVIATAASARAPDSRAPDSVVPAPGSALLVVVGLGLTGWIKRRLA